MSTFQTFGVSFVIFLVVACLLISIVWFCTMWFGIRTRVESQMRDVMGGKYQSHGALVTSWHGLQVLCFCIVGVFALVTISLWMLAVAPFYWAWYRLRGKPMPTPDHVIHDDVGSPGNYRLPQ